MTAASSKYRRNYYPMHSRRDLTVNMNKVLNCFLQHCAGAYYCQTRYVFRTRRVASDLCLPASALFS